MSAPGHGHGHGHDFVSPLVLPEGLPDGELLSATRRLVGRSNQLLALLLSHLAEVEARGLHRARACSSLYTYCIYELRFSEDEAFRRVAAARLVRRFPALLDSLTAGELHLTGLLMLGPHLTTENLTEVLARSKYRTKKEVARLVRQLDPLPDVPARIEPLGPAPARIVTTAPTYRQFVESLSPVRELSAGDRPREWTEGTELIEGTLIEGTELIEGRLIEGTQASGDCSNDAGLPGLGALPAPTRLQPQRFRVDFTAGEEYVRLVEAAQALLSHSAERVPLEELQLRALRAFVAELERTKRVATKRSARPIAATSPGEQVRPVAVPPEPNEVGEAAGSEGVSGATGSEHPRWRGRHVPAAIRRAVFERDQERCAFIDDSGQRCRETHRLELHHLDAFAKGGEHTLENIALRCVAHNALAAEQDFGADFIQQSRNSSRHESCRHQSGR